MSFKLILKTRAFRLLEKLPNRLGDRLYHKIQKTFGGKNIHLKIEASRNSYSDFQRLSKLLNISTSGKTIIEIGSGWLPIMPYFFKYLGEASTVITYDINRHYDRKNIDSLNLEFSEKFKISIEKSEIGKYNLPSGIKYYPNTDLNEVPIRKAEIVFSRFVLEHINPLSIKRIHEIFKMEIPDAYIIHMISPSDHRAYVDKNLSNQDFLRFSEEQWQKKQTRFDYHNRLRLPEYLKIFKELKYEVLLLESESANINSNIYKKFKSVPLHNDYKEFSDDELTAGSINIVLKLSRNK